MIKKQRGEAMIAMMVIVLLVMWAWKGHMSIGPMGMMTIPAGNAPPVSSSPASGTSAAP